MSESNTKLLIICVFTFSVTLARMYFGYESWDTKKDLESALAITTAVGGVLKLSDLLKPKE